MGRESRMTLAELPEPRAVYFRRARLLSLPHAPVQPSRIESEVLSG